MSKLDDLIEELRGDGREDDAEELEKLRGSTLRQKASAADKLEKERDALKAENEALKRAPKVREAFKEAGVDLDELSKLERKAIESYDGDVDEEAIAAFIEENELPVLESSDDEDKDDEPAAAKVAKAARRPGDAKQSTTLTAETISEWGIDKKLAFADANPDAWEALKRGESVNAREVKIPA